MRGFSLDKIHHALSPAVTMLGLLTGHGQLRLKSQCSLSYLFIYDGSFLLESVLLHIDLLIGSFTPFIHWFAVVIFWGRNLVRNSPCLLYKKMWFDVAVRQHFQSSCKKCGIKKKDCISFFYILSSLVSLIKGFYLCKNQVNKMLKLKQKGLNNKPNIWATFLLTHRLQWNQEQQILLSKWMDWLACSFQVLSQPLWTVVWFAFVGLYETFWWGLAPKCGAQL